MHLFVLTYDILQYDVNKFAALWLAGKDTQAPLQRDSLFGNRAATDLVNKQARFLVRQNRLILVVGKNFVKGLKELVLELLRLPVVLVLFDEENSSQVHEPCGTLLQPLYVITDVHVCADPAECNQTKLNKRFGAHQLEAAVPLSAVRRRHVAHATATTTTLAGAETPAAHVDRAAHDWEQQFQALASRHRPVL